MLAGLLTPWLERTYHPAFLVFDGGGRLKEAGGSLGLYGLEGLAPGTASDRIDFLTGMLPVSAPLELPMVSPGAGAPRSVLIEPLGREGTRVILLDATAEQKRLRRIMQVENEKALVLERSVPPPVLTASGIAVLEQSGAGFRVLGEFPAWLRRLVPEVRFFPFRLLYENLSFLEYFMPQAERAWRENFDERTRWVETDELGNEFEIQASAFLAGDRRLIVLTSRSEDYAERQRILQKARLMHLASERQTKDIEKKDILLHSIVHDLIGPLGVIVGTLAMLEEDTVDPAKRRMCDIALLQCKRQEQMIRDILDVYSADVARLDAFSTNPSTAPNMRDVVAGVLESMQPAFMAKRVPLRLQDESAGISTLVSGEVARLERVFVNLLENALRYTPAGGQVVVRLLVDPKFVQVDVCDGGPGIEPGVLGRLFEKFSQGRDKSGKMGLGLFYCRITIERWGGAVGAENVPAGGARFWVRLPRLVP
jgi:signal transduction histidine kinase